MHDLEDKQRWADQRRGDFLLARVAACVGLVFLVFVPDLCSRRADSPSLTGTAYLAVCLLLFALVIGFRFAWIATCASLGFLVVAAGLLAWRGEPLPGLTGLACPAVGLLLALRISFRWVLGALVRPPLAPPPEVLASVLEAARERFASPPREEAGQDDRVRPAEDGTREGA
jgi:hypothetical protein